MKAALAVLIGQGLRERRYTFVAIGSSAFVLFSVVSLAAAFGFSATARHGVTSERQRGQQRLAAAEARVAELRDKRKAVPSHRPMAVVELAGFESSLTT